MAGVAAGHPATAQVGADILAAGGTAADAAVAAVLTACVGETIMTGLGGGGFAIYFEAATGQVTCLDFFCAVPGTDRDRPAEPMRPIPVSFGAVPLAYEIGGASVGVPGVPAGCGELHRRYGRLPWSEVVAPAIALARCGVPLPAMHAAALPSVAPALTVGPGARVYAPEGDLLGPGDLLYHPGLADALTTLAAEGPATFYTGAVAQTLVAAVRGDGGALGPADLAGYRVLVQPARTARLAGRTVLARSDLNRTVATVAALPGDLAALDRPRRAVALAGALASRDRGGHGETTNVSVLDRHGNACVVTTSLGIGSGVWLPGLGVHLNSMLGEGELRGPGEPDPGSRMSSMMCPMVVLDAAGRVELALGSAGASRIRTAILHTLLGVLLDAVDVPDAVALPRFHVATGGGRAVAHAEPDLPGDECAALAAAGYELNRWQRRNHYFGGVSAVGPAGAAGDPRRDGVGLMVAA